MNRIHSRICQRVALGIMLVWKIQSVCSQTMPDYTGLVFPLNNALNTRIDSLPVHLNSQNYINSIGISTGIHPDFGTQWEDGGIVYQMGIPYNLVGKEQKLVPIIFTLYDDESDPGPWPIPANPLIETVFDWRKTDDGDRHMLIIDTVKHMLYETGNVFGNQTGTSWEGGGGAQFDLTSNKLRPEGWTSADAAGLPIFPLLIRYDEVERAVKTGGEISHAIRFTASKTQKAYIWPARHYASTSTDKNLPPMGLRFRLKANFNISGYSPRIQVILRTFKKYGIILADNGSNWYFQGTHDDRWDDEEINSLKKLKGGDFEAVDISSWLQDPRFDSNSGAVPVATSVNNGGCRSYRFNDGKIVYNKHAGLVYMTYEINEAENVKCYVTDLKGTVVFYVKKEFKIPGKYIIPISTSEMPSGIYFFKISRAGNNSQMCRFTVFH